MDLAIKTSIILILCYISAFIYSCIVLTVPLFKNLRIQKSKTPMRLLYRRLPLILFNMTLGVLYGFGAIYFFRDYFSSTLPSIWVFLAQLSILLIFDDVYFYFYHLLLHKNKFLYRHIHSIHHKASAPYPLEFIYSHPLETSISCIGLFLGYVVIYLIFGDISIYTFWGYSILRIIHEADIHSGIKSIIFKWLPFYGSTQHHDSHHSRLNGNYASTFSFWDKILGTKITDKEQSDT